MYRPQPIMPSAGSFHLVDESHGHSPRKAAYQRASNRHKAMNLPHLAVPSMMPEQMQSWASTPTFNEASFTTGTPLGMPGHMVDPATYAELMEATSASCPTSQMLKTKWYTYDENGTENDIPRPNQLTSGTVIPEYVFYTKQQLEDFGDPMHISGPSLDQDNPSMKVPTNTPTDANQSIHDTTGGSLSKTFSCSLDFFQR
jgi:hypothetical protein